MPNVSVKLTFTQTEISFSGAWIFSPPDKPWGNVKFNHCAFSYCWIIRKKVIDWMRRITWFISVFCCFFLQYESLTVREKYLNSKGRLCSRKANVSSHSSSNSMCKQNNLYTEWHCVKTTTVDSVNCPSPVLPLIN